MLFLPQSESWFKTLLICWTHVKVKAVFLIVNLYIWFLAKHFAKHFCKDIHEYIHEFVASFVVVFSLLLVQAASVLDSQSPPSSVAQLADFPFNSLSHRVQWTPCMSSTNHSRPAALKPVGEQPVAQNCEKNGQHSAAVSLNSKCLWKVSHCSILNCVSMFATFWSEMHGCVRVETLLLLLYLFHRCFMFHIKTETQTIKLKLDR